MSKELKEIHDLLLSVKPESAEHDEATCVFCSGRDIETTPSGGGSMSDKVFTEEEVAAAIAKAVSDATSSLQARVTELETSHQQNEIDKLVTEATAELETKIADLQGQLDAAVIEAQTAKADKEALEAFWESAVKEAEETAAREARREERLSALKESNLFPDDYLEKHEDRFVAMTDEEFTARLEEYEALASASGGGKGGPPVKTGLHAAREETQNGSALREILNLRSEGIDPRLVRS